MTRWQMTRWVRVMIGSLTLGLLIAARLQAQDAVVLGTVASHDSAVVSAQTSVEISLQDVSRADITPPIVAQMELPRATEWPVAFRLPYDPSRIDPNHRYAVVARVVDGRSEVFITRQPVLVITQGHGNRADLTLSRAPGAARMMSDRPLAPQAGPEPQTPLARLPPPAALTGFPLTFAGTLTCASCPAVRYHLNLFADDSFFLRTTPISRSGGESRDTIGSWVLSSDRRALVLQGNDDGPQVFDIRDRLTLRTLDVTETATSAPRRGELRRAAFQALDVHLTMTGVYEDPDGRPAFAECATGKRLQLTGAGAEDLRRAANPSGRRPLSVLATLEGRIVNNQDGTTPQADAAALSIERVVHVAEGQRCSPRFSAAPLEQTLWTLTRLGERQPATSPALASATLTFRADPHAFAAAAGCTRITGRYDRSGDELQLESAGALTACAADGAGGQAMVGMLHEVRAYRVLGRTLELFDSSRHLLARFEAPGE